MTKENLSDIVKREVSETVYDYTHVFQLMYIALLSLEQGMKTNMVKHSGLPSIRKALKVLKKLSNGSCYGQTSKYGSPESKEKQLVLELTELMNNHIQDWWW